MRGALEAAAVRVASSMKPQNVANTIWGLATLGWQAGEGPMRGALEAKIQKSVRWDKTRWLDEKAREV